MLIQINDSPIQFYTSDKSDLDTIKQPYTVVEQTTDHDSVSHRFVDHDDPSSLTTSTPSYTKVNKATTTTYIITLL